MIRKKDVINVLKNVIDPEVGINIVDLGLIYDVKVEKNNAYVKMTLTTPGCPLHSFFVQDVEKEIKNIGVKNVNVDLTFDPPWSPEKMSKEVKKKLGL